MTENKRFTSDIHRICDNNEEIACADTMDDAETIVDKLNEQEKKIRELEKENGRMKGAFKRKFDYDIEDVVDEICDEDW